MHALLVILAYLMGSIPFGYLIVREMSGSDVRSLGSGNIGATNVLRVAGKLPALVVLTMDLAKGCIPVVLGRLVGAPPPILAAIALAAILGHVYPLFLGFHGGKGVATAVGAFLALAPMATVGAVAVFFMTLSWKRYVSLASLVAVACFPVFVLLFGRVGWMAVPWQSVFIAGALTAIVVFVRHRSNLQRIGAGTETRIGEGLEVDEP